MSGRVIFPLATLLVGGMIVAGIYWGAPLLKERMQTSTSDAVKSRGSISIGTDNFIGYYVLCGSHLRSLVRNEGIDLRCVDDDADYPKRMEKLKRGDIQIAVATIDSYELNAVATAFPGSIITVIDESKGADAIVARKSKVKNVDDLKRGGLKVAFAAGSPSEHLLKVIAADFDIPQWRGNDKTWRVEVKSSQEAAKKFTDGVVDIAVLWEPDIAKVLRSDPGAIKVIGTEVTSRKIVDVVIARREYARDNPDMVELLLRNYFKTLYFYRQNPETAAAHAAEYTKMKPNEIQDALKGVHWVNLQENALLWFGLTEPGMQPQYGLIDAIESTTRILVEHGDFPKNPLPREDSRYIVWSGFIEKLYQSGLASPEKVDLKSGETLTREFSELSDEGWMSLRQIGTLRVRPIVFQRGAGELSLEAKENIDRIAEVIKSYPNFRILVEGHTSTRGDANVNLELSQERAESVARYLMVTYGVRQSRVRPVGLGGKQPLIRRLDETDREYYDRLSRVVVKLMTEAY